MSIHPEGFSVRVCCSQQPPCQALEARDVRGHLEDQPGHAFPLAGQLVVPAATAPHGHATAAAAAAAARVVHRVRERHQGGCFVRSYCGGGGALAGLVPSDKTQADKAIQAACFSPWGRGRRQKLRGPARRRALLITGGGNARPLCEYLVGRRACGAGIMGHRTVRVRRDAASEGQNSHIAKHPFPARALRNIVPHLPHPVVGSSSTRGISANAETSLDGVHTICPSQSAAASRWVTNRAGAAAVPWCAAAAAGSELLSALHHRCPQPPPEGSPASHRRRAVHNSVAAPAWRASRGSQLSENQCCQRARTV